MDLILIELIQVALGIRNSLSRIPSNGEWNYVYKLSIRHRIAGVLFVGIEKLPKEQSPHKRLLLKWFGQAEYYRAMYELQRKAIQSLNELWRAEGLRVFELKGDTIGRFYPRPELRYSCDYDCFLSDYEQGNRLVEQEGVAVNRDFYKNSSFVWEGLYVENHQFCTPVRGNRAMKRLEIVLRGLVSENNVVDFNALFLMEHIWAHFFEDALSLKQIMDWVVFREKCWGEVDAELFEREAKACGFWNFSKSIERIVEQLLQNDSPMQFEDKYTQRLWEQVLSGGGSVDINKGWKTRFQLFVNFFRNGWRYRAFSNHSAFYVMLRTVAGFVFDKNPKLN